LARTLEHVHFDAIVSSDLSRAFETASAVACGRDVVVEKEPRLRETSFGSWEGLTWAQIVERHPEMEHATWHDPRGFLPNGGESFGDVMVRVGVALERLRQRPEERICAVSHAGAIHAALRVLFGEKSPALGVRLEPTCINRIRFENGEAHVVTLNDVTHLATI
jgi:broad specificity phosphatase PhoE